MTILNSSLNYAEKLKSQPSSQLIEDTDVTRVQKANWKKRTVFSEAYLPSDDLLRVVDLAIALGRPLLLQGEPGCGKTQLAHSVAYALGLPLEIAYVKSTSRAQDLLYTYDAVARLYDSQIGRLGPKDKAGKPLARSPGNYVALAPLGRAIARAAFGRRSVVLIDEIDKADLDFPNDLLWELDRMEFNVPEAPELACSAGKLRPIVVITHNEEKPLPPAFLRRCIYHYIEFPATRDQLEKILALHGIKSGPLLTKSIEVVQELRKKDLNKKPGLTELIDWVWYGQSQNASTTSLERLQNIEALLKDRADQERARRESGLAP
jgi:MoxR-like ATPase